MGGAQSKKECTECFSSYALFSYQALLAHPQIVDLLNFQFWWKWVNLYQNPLLYISRGDGPMVERLQSIEELQLWHLPGFKLSSVQVNWCWEANELGMPTVCQVRVCWLLSQKGLYGIKNLSSKISILIFFFALVSTALCTRRGQWQARICNRPKLLCNSCCRIGKVCWLGLQNWHPCWTADSGWEGQSIKRENKT